MKKGETSRLRLTGIRSMGRLRLTRPERVQIHSPRLGTTTALRWPSAASCFLFGASVLWLIFSSVNPVQTASRVRLGGETCHCNQFHSNRLRRSNPVATFAAID